MTFIISHFIQNVHLQHRKLTFSKLKLSYILIYNYTADEQLEKEKKERKNLAKKKEKERKSYSGHWAMEWSGRQMTRRKWQWWRAKDVSSFGSQ
jgi:hypothetical protein